MKTEEEEVEYDVFYRGTKDELFAFLYPLTGPSHPLFEHLQLKKMLFDVNNKTFDVLYQPTDFENIDKQKEEIRYKSILQPTQSNYFYSIFQPQYNCFVWQSIDHFAQMRPKQQKKENSQADKGKIEMEVVSYQDPSNKVRQQIEDAIITQLKDNWECSKQQYLLHLAK